MIPNDFREHCKQIAHWVDWDKTVDQFMHGDPEIEVKGIAITWLATNPVLQKSAELGANFVISHEGAFYTQYSGWASEKGHHKAKHKLLGELNLILMRCHDTWDRMPDVGICDAWTQFLGFPASPRPIESMHRTCNVEGMKALEVVDHVLKKVRPLGQETVGFLGDPNKKVSRLGLGTGACTRLPVMYEMGADILLATDDGMQNTWSGLYAVDQDIPVILVNHATAELPGMKKLVEYVKGKFPGVPVHYLECGFPYRSIG